MMKPAVQVPGPNISSTIDMIHDVFMYTSNVKLVPRSTR